MNTFQYINKNFQITPKTGFSFLIYLDGKMRTIVMYQ